MKSYTDWRGTWSMRVAGNLHEFLMRPKSLANITLEPCTVRNRLIGYDVIADPKLLAWRKTFLSLRGIDPSDVKLHVPDVSPTTLSTASDDFFEKIPGDGARRNRIVRLEGDVMDGNKFKMVEVFCVENAIIGAYPIMFIRLDRDAGTSPDGSAVAIRR